MLVLTRKMGESIIIGNEEIVVTVLGVNSGKVRLGFTAPPECIDRERFGAVYAFHVCGG